MSTRWPHDRSIDRSTKLSLDVGCGFAERTDDKRSTYGALPRGVVNVDIERPTVRIKNFIRGDAHRLPIRDGCFDQIYASHLLEHLEKPHLFLIEAKRVLREGGTIEVTVPSIYYKGTYEDPNHKWFFSAKILKGLVGRYFQISKLEGWDGVWFPVKARRLLFVILNLERFLPPDLCKAYRVSGHVVSKGSPKE